VIDSVKRCSHIKKSKNGLAIGIGVKCSDKISIHFLRSAVSVENPRLYAD